MTAMIAKKKLDRRTQRSRGKLSTALVQLIQEKLFDDITVQNVIDRAHVGRATFYTHYRGKEDLLDQQWELFLDMFAGQIDWDNAGKGSFVPVRFLFRHLQDEAHQFYKGLVRSRKAERIFRTGVGLLSRKLEAPLSERFPKPPIPIPIVSNYLASELFMLLTWWLDHGMPYTPDQMDTIYHRLINPTLMTL
jgi:AcrR family transcriptional regulator